MADHSILNQIQEAVKSAMRNHDKELTITLRMAISEIKKEEIDNRVEVDDILVTTILQRMIKQRKDASSQFNEANRIDLADKEIREINMLSEYLPEQISEKDLLEIVSKEMAAIDATSLIDMGKAMGVLKPKLHGKADMSMVSKIVKELLSD